MSKPTTPDDFDPIFRQRVLVVGGHAVNLWGSYYAHRGDPELQQFAPFISKDGDVFLRDKALAKAVAAAAGWNFRDNPETRSPMLGHIYLVRGDQELRVDALRSVNGINNEDLSTTEELKFSEGQTYLLPAPEVMLKAKIANLSTLKQDDRQDARHVQIMVACCRNYLTDYVSAALAGQVTERDAIDRFMDTLRVIQMTQAQTLNLSFDLNLEKAIPARASLKDLSRLPRLAAFYDHQMKSRE